MYLHSMAGMNKYTVVYTANDRYDSQIDYPTSRVEYIQGETLDEAIDELLVRYGFVWTNVIRVY